MLPQGSEEGEESIEISLHALQGLANSKIMRMEGKIQGPSAMVLIGSGSTHSFLDEGTSKRLKCELTGTHPLSVTVANDNKVMCQFACEGFWWEMHGEPFEADLRLLKLGVMI